MKANETKDMTYYQALLFELRQSTGLSQRDLAKAIGVSFSTISRLEGGLYLPRKSTAKRIEGLYASIGNKSEQVLSRQVIVSENKGIEEDLVLIIDSAKAGVTRVVNIALLRRNFRIGQRIDQEILTTRAKDYGGQIIETLAAYLTDKYGRGFDKSSLYSFLRFYRLFPTIFQKPDVKSFLSWSHYSIMLSVENDDARTYYEKEALACGWSVRALQRAIHSQSYERLLSTNPEGMPPLPTEVAKPNDPTEYIKTPVIMDFLGLPDRSLINESDLEQAIIDHLAQFLLELGKGYSFIARQKRIHTAKKDYYVDLVFYNYYLRCFVLIDLKTDKIEHKDVGQMDMYVRMFDEMERCAGDNPTLGIVLCAETDEDIARYSILKGSEQIFAAKYKTYLPDEQELKREIDHQKALFYIAQQSKKRH